MKGHAYTLSLGSGYGYACESWNLKTHPNKQKTSMNSHEANSGRTPSTFKCTAIEKQYNQDIKNTLASQLKKNGEWHKNRNERENMYTNKPKWSHKEM